MRGKAHLFISAFLCQTFGLIFFKDFTPVPLIIGAICGLFADIDEPNSKISYYLIGHIGGAKRVGGVNYSFTDKKHNKKITFKRQLALTIVLILIAIALFFLTRNIWFSLLCIYVSYLPWTTHRTLSHSLLSAIVFGVCMYIGLNSYNLGKYGIYAGFGYLCHLLEDSLTVTGVPYFYPLSKKKFKIPLMKTGTSNGGLFEWGVIFGTGLLCIVIYLFKFGLISF